MRKILVCLFFCTLSFYTQGQISLVKDIDSAVANSNPSRLTVFNNMLVFFADDGINGNELWVIDTSGPHLVFNINPGAASSLSFSNYVKMAVAGGKIYFPADDGVNGLELYSWDGLSADAPALAYDFHPGAQGTVLNEMTTLNDRVYFSANDPVYGQELFVYNPVTSSLQRLTDIYPGLTSSNPHNLTVFRNKIYFSATSNTAGTELYAYDPATNNTILVSDINAGVAGSDPSSITVLGKKMYFSAVTASKGRELYSIDSNNFIIRLTDVFAGTGNGMALSPIAKNIIGEFNNRIFFAADDNSSLGQQLFVYNPSNGIAKMSTLINISDNAYPESFTPYNGKLYFAADDGVHGSEIWVIDNDSVYLAEVLDPAASSNPVNFTVFNGELYFSAYSANTGNELYKYTHFPTGVQNIKFDADIKAYPNPASSEFFVDMNLKHSEKLGVIMSDISGKLIYQSLPTNYTPGSHKINIPLSNLSNGTYFYRIVNNTGRNCFSGKMLKQ